MEEEGLRRCARTIRERFWAVVLTVLIKAAVLDVYHASKTYEASADLLITPASGEDSPLTSISLVRESVDPTRDVEAASLSIGKASART